MGRRSINTTKSGKFMNPTDQARKEARKRELRKNKKQRMLVRAAVLKGKDPYQIIADMERLDQMEYNVNTPPPLNEKVLRDKRRKMKETWDRLCRLYSKEDHDRFVELKRLEIDYEAKRNQMIKFYEAVKSTQDVILDDIPLPAAPVEPGSLIGSFQPILPVSEPVSILKKNNLTPQINANKEPPGVPPGPPPILSDLEDDDDDEKERERSKKIRFNDEEREADINEFLKEIEQVEKSVSVKESLPKALPTLPLPTQPAPNPTLQPPVGTMPPPAGLNFGPNQGKMPNPPLMMFRPPMPMGVRPPNQQIIPRPGMPGTGPMRPNMPTGMPGQLPTRLPIQQVRQHMAQATLPSRKDDKKTHLISDKATIEAKPQLRNLSADATRFTPVALRVKRVESKSKKAGKTGFESDMRRYPGDQKTSHISSTSKDDAYDQFMKEMSNFL